MTADPYVPLGLPVAVPAASLSRAATPRDHAASTPLGETTGVHSSHPVSSSSSGRAAVPEGGSRRLGRTGLDQLRASLSTRDWQILRIVSAHRYLSTRQLERFCFIDHATPLTAARVCRRVLRRLATHSILLPLDRRIGGVRAGSAAYVWQVGPIGHRLLATAGRGRAHEPSLLFLRHTLAVADAHLTVLDASRAQVLQLESVATEPDCWLPFTGIGGSRELLRPDLAVTTVDPDDPAFVNQWLIEVDCGTEHLKRLLAKCATYQQGALAGATEADGGFPLVLWAMDEPRRVSLLAAAIANDTTLDSSLFRVALQSHLAGVIAGGIR